MRGRRALVAVIGGCLLYAAMVRRRVLTWGATREEARSRLPGDELLETPDGQSTRAISINAPTSDVWPWLAQMGPAPRGGAYTYDWIENLLGLDMHSASRVLPEFQHPRVGDTIGFGSNQMRLERVEPKHALAWRSPDGNWVWAFALREEGAGTRLISRNRFRLPTFVARIGMLPMEPGSLVMERKMLLGIKQRAEGLGSTVPPATRQPGEAARVLVAYATRYGSTTGVAERIAARLAECGASVHLHRVDDVADASAYDAIVLGSPVFDQRWLPEADRFVQGQREALAGRPVWLFSVGTFGDRRRVIGPLMKREPKGIDAVQQDLAARDYRVFAGVIDRHQWPFFSRLFYYALGGRLGDNRDWVEIEAWSDTIARELATADGYRAASPLRSAQ